MHQKIKKLAKIFIVMLVTVLTLAACSGANDGSTQELRLASAVPLNTLNHIINTESANSQVISSFLEGLLTYDENQNLIGSMAETWNSSSDGLTYTFHLRDGIEWSNGVPVTAKDFVFGWQTLATNPKAGYAQMLVDAGIKNARAVISGERPVSELGVVASDDKTLVVTLDSPSLLFEKIMAFGSFSPINEAFYNSVGGADSFGTSVDTVLSNGPFVLKVWQPDAEYVLEKNDKYWNAQNVLLTKVSTRIIKEPLTQATLYDNGEIDRLALGTNIFDRYKDDPNLVRQDEAAWYYMYLSGRNGNNSPVLGNRNFRAAVAHVLDKQVITDQILKNGSVPANYLVPQKFDNLNNRDFRTYANQFNESIFNLEKARDYLSAAKSELVGEDLSFELVISDGVVARTLYENIKAQIEQGLPGVKVNLKVIPSNTFFNELKELNTNASTGGWGADFIDVSTYFSIFRSGDSHNFGRWSNAEYDRLLEQADRELDPQKRWDYFVEAERILIEDYSIIPLYQRGSTAVMNPRVKGFKLNPVSPEVFFKYVYFE